VEYLDFDSLSKEDRCLYVNYNTTVLQPSRAKSDPTPAAGSLDVYGEYEFDTLDGGLIVREVFDPLVDGDRRRPRHRKTPYDSFEEDR
jgi:hypothetical protein